VGKQTHARGLQVMNALAVDAHGVPLGLVDQRWWAREQPPRAKKIKSWKGDLEDKETRYWVEALVAVDALMAQHAERTKPWFQLDRGGNCRAVLRTAIERSLLLTVAMVHNRRLVTSDKRTAYLRDHLQHQRPLGTYDLSVPARPGRAARIAHMTVRTASVTLDLRVARKRHVHVTLQACLAREEGGPKGDQLEWFLLTTHPLATFDQARAVVHGYTQRFRVEELHRAWKSGVCNVEQTQLRSRQAIVKWATRLPLWLHAPSAPPISPALARPTPDVDASTEFSSYEIEAAFVLAKRKRDRRRKVLLSEMSALVAQEGGFAGEYSGRLPGAQVLARGLERIATLAKGLRNLEEM
jgi:Transposase Tn5 dimerisation domain